MQHFSQIAPRVCTSVLFIYYCACTHFGLYLVTVSDRSSTKMFNSTVYNKSVHKTLVPWRFHSVNPPDVTFREFYYQEGTRFVEGGSHFALQLQLHTTFVGSSKKLMDLVDSDLKVLDVTSVFGPYVPC